MDKSLVVAGDGGAGGGQRYGLLETVREYAVEKLDGGADGAAIPPATRPTSWTWWRWRSRR